MASPLWMFDRLSAETAKHHGDADSTLDRLFHSDLSVEQYQGFLVGSYGFEAPLEAALAMSGSLDSFLDLRARARAGMIAQDLMRLGLRPQMVAELPMCMSVPHFRGAAEALGWMYVAERAALTHQVIHRHLMTRMPHEMIHASSYLQSAGGLLGARWRQFGEALDRVASHPVVAERVVSAANEAFRTYRNWATTTAGVDHRVAV